MSRDSHSEKDVYWARANEKQQLLRMRWRRVSIGVAVISTAYVDRSRHAHISYFSNALFLRMAGAFRLLRPFAPVHPLVCDHSCLPTIV